MSSSSLLIRVFAAAAFLSLVSCSTISGIGQDVQSGGRAISRGANTVQKGITN